MTKFLLALLFSALTFLSVNAQSTKEARLDVDDFWFSEYLEHDDDPNEWYSLAGRWFDEKFNHGEIWQTRPSDFKRERHFIELWIRSKAVKNLEIHWQSKFRVDCKNMTFEITYLNEYFRWVFKNGDYVPVKHKVSGSPERNSNPILPDSVGEGSFKQVCDATVNLTK
jgi:hypothetical protein